MAKKTAKWREYQEQVAQYFRNLGMRAEVEKAVEGVRATHDIDVWVTFNGNGVDQRWAVECKRYGSACVSKDKVLTLASIIEDVGAHAGFIVSETGFQSGAINAARKTNIELTSLGDLYKNGEPALIKEWMAEVQPWLSEMRYAVGRELEKRRGDYSQTEALRDLWIMMTRLNKMEEGMIAARSGELSVKIDLKEVRFMTEDPEKTLSEPVVMEIPVFGLTGALMYIRERMGAFERRLAMILRGETEIFHGTLVVIGQLGPKGEGTEATEAERPSPTPLTELPVLLSTARIPPLRRTYTPPSEGSDTPEDDPQAP